MFLHSEAYRARICTKAVIEIYWPTIKIIFAETFKADK